MEPVPPPNTTPERFYTRTFAVATLVVLALLLYRIVAPIFGALAWAALAAVVLHPLHRRLTKLLRGRDKVSAALLTVLTGLLVLGPVTALAAAFASQLDQILPMVEELAARGSAGADDSGATALLGRVQTAFGIGSGQLREWLGEGAKAGLQALAAMGGKIFVGAIGTAVGFTVMIFVLFFLLRDGAAMLTIARKLIPLSERDNTRLYQHLDAVIQALIYGIGLTALIQGAMLGAGFAVLGLPAPVVFGVIGALFALLPVVGTPLIWGPAVVVLATQGRWVAAIALLAWGLVVSSIDNVLRPILVSGRARIGTLTVCVGVIGGVSAFGTVGLFIGPVILSLCLALARFTIETRQRERSPPPPP